VASAAYERRNARARALGYQSYYDYRAHGNGARPPDAPRLAGEALRKARGHAGPADLVRDAGKPGTLITATPDPTSRQPDGTYDRIYVTAIGEDGSEREYVLSPKKMKPGEMDAIVAGLGAGGAVFSPSPSLDISDYGTEPEPDDEFDLDDDYFTDSGYDDIPF
jgi:hypothetical protein